MTKDAFRVGWGIDAHRLGGPGPITLGGLEIPSTVGVQATSDGDVIAHAVADALLGAAVLGDLGEHFPSSDPSFHDADSMELLRRVVAMIEEAGWRPSHVDVTLVAQSIRVAPHRDGIRTRLAGVLGLDVGSVSVKATTTDGMGLIGQESGIAAMASAAVAPLP
ncbi:MAG: 2-C-methyl-D-erythritol 2,4-cyclodiphosphate synthase [Acidimicrobiia bacterium]|nr:2-C-methyl-D-erythritol 2,4-cyclodiphosphate synthase [Acidimicrobiia bacterium]